MTTTRTLSGHPLADASFEVLRLALVLGCAATLALAGVSFRI